MTEDALAKAVASQGFRLVSIGSDNVRRGHAYVSRIRSDWSFYDPIAGDWYAYLGDER